MKKDLLVTLGTEKNIEWAKQLFSSVYWNAGWKGEYMLLAYKVPERELEWFRKKGILVKKCRPIIRRHMENDNRPIFFSKFYLFTREFKKWKTVIYLDSDIIVRASLDELAKTETFAAVADVFGFDKLRNQFIGSPKELYQELKDNFELETDLFNAGVMAFSTEIIKEDTFDELKHLLSRYKKVCRCADQSIFNLFFYKRWEKLPLVYNIYSAAVINRWGIRQKDFEGIVLHFTGPNKPWMAKSHFYNEWKDNLDKADRMDLKRIQRGNRWTGERIRNYSQYLKMRERAFRPIFLPVSFVKGIIWKTLRFLKNNFPGPYSSFRSIFCHQNSFTMP
ncbi:MAG: hypothetical protein NTY68_01140 [Candidatus Micrarchaeota archaeon]|nr:hypothetical protein [Candidatus Micrarchaeota archaeon]